MYIASALRLHALRKLRTFRVLTQHFGPRKGEIYLGFSKFEQFIHFTHNSQRSHLPQYNRWNHVSEII